MSFGIATPQILTPYVRCKIGKNSVQIGKTSEFTEISTIGSDTNQHRVSIRAIGGSCVIAVDERTFAPILLMSKEWQVVIQSDLSAEPSGESVRKVLVIEQ
jgi:hypothetical protein